MVDFLLSLPRFADQGAAAYAPGLDRVKVLLEAMGNPHVGLPAIHIGGTNGKGSTASLAAAIATASGKKVGLHTSPHLLDVRERMRVDGVPVSGDWLDSAIFKHKSTIEEIKPSFFEATVALSLLAFREHDVELAVVEVGLGGRLDATNVLDDTVAVVTHIGLDHTDLLGETLPEIAREKAGIAKPEGAFLHAVDAAEAREALEDEAASRGADVEDVHRSCEVSDVQEKDGEIAFRLLTPLHDYGRLTIPLPGAFQTWNAALAVRAIERRLGDATTRLSTGVGKEVVRRGFGEVQSLAGLRGRSEQIGRVVLDVAHNEDGWKAALNAARPPEGGRLYVICNTMTDKQPERLARLLSSSSAIAVPLELDAPRAQQKSEWKALLEEWNVETLDFESMAAAVDWFKEETGPDDRLLATGSHLVVAGVLGVLEGGGRSESQD